MSASPKVTFRDEHGDDLKPWRVHAGMVIVATDYTTGDGSLICVVAAKPAAPEPEPEHHSQAKHDGSDTFLGEPGT